MTNPSESQEIYQDLVQDDQNVQQEGQIGIVGFLPPNQNDNEPPANAQQGQTIPTQVIQFPFGLETVALPTIAVGIRVDHIRAICLLLVGFLIDEYLQMIIRGEMLSVSEMIVRRHVDQVTGTNGITDENIDDLMAVPPTIIFSPMTTIVATNIEHHPCTQITGTHPIVEPPRTTLNVQTTTNVSDHPIPPTTDESPTTTDSAISAATTTNNTNVRIDIVTNTQSAIEPVAFSTAPSHRISTTSQPPLPNPVPILEQAMTLSQPSNEVADENNIEMEETNMTTDTVIPSSSDVNETGGNPLNSVKRRHPDEDDDDSVPNGKRASTQS